MARSFLRANVSPDRLKNDSGDGKEVDLKTIAWISEFAFSMLGFLLKDSCRIFQKLPFGEALGVATVKATLAAAGKELVPGEFAKMVYAALRRS